MRAEFASSKAEIYDASDDGSQDVGTVLEKICRKSIQTGLLVRTIMDELNYFIYSSKRKTLKSGGVTWLANLKAHPAVQTAFVRYRQQQLSDCAAGLGWARC